jgi:hypothetical protein
MVCLWEGVGRESARSWLVSPLPPPRVSYETSFDLKQPKLEPKLVSTLSETRRLFRLFRFNIETACFGVSIEPKQRRRNRNKPKKKKNGQNVNWITSKTTKSKTIDKKKLHHLTQSFVFHRQNEINSLWQRSIFGLIISFFRHFHTAILTLSQ